MVCLLSYFFVDPPIGCNLSLNSCVYYYETTLEVFMVRAITATAFPPLWMRANQLCWLLLCSGLLRLCFDFWALPISFFYLDDTVHDDVLCSLKYLMQFLWLAGLWSLETFELDDILGGIYQACIWLEVVRIMTLDWVNWWSPLLISYMNKNGIIFCILTYKFWVYYWWKALKSWGDCILHQTSKICQ